MLAKRGDILIISVYRALIELGSLDPDYIWACQKKDHSHALVIYSRLYTIL